MGKRERMGRKLDAWLGRSWKAAKLNALLNLAVSRLAVLRHQRRVRRDHARSDVAELLRQGQQERALLRAENVIREENMLDAFAMAESYCHVVAERSGLLENQNQRECPEELREAVAGLIFAESRCGELPELHEVRSILAARLGKEFVAAAVELRNNCGVNSRIIQKMSTKPASLESRTKVAMDIAAEIGIALHLEEPSDPCFDSFSLGAVPKQPPSSAPAQPVAAAAGGGSDGLARDEYSSESAKVRERYKSAASAAQAAFESAAYAAAAARAAVELSRSESQGKVGPGDHSSSHRAPAGGASGGRATQPTLIRAPARRQKARRRRNRARSRRHFTEEGRGGWRTLLARKTKKGWRKRTHPSRRRKRRSNRRWQPSGGEARRGGRGAGSARSVASRTEQKTGTGNQKKKKKGKALRATAARSPPGGTSPVGFR